MHRTAADFWKAYAELTEEIRRRADKKFALLKAHPQHPSLQFKKIGERHGQEILVSPRDVELPRPRH
jgi:hypothetical protein